jgi:hypothetical protein
MQELAKELEMHNHKKKRERESPRETQQMINYSRKKTSRIKLKKTKQQISNFTGLQSCLCVGEN